MTQNSLGVAVIGVGMVGRAHAAGYRTAAGLFDLRPPGHAAGRDRRRLRAVRGRRGQAVRLRALRDLVGGHRRRPRHRRRERRGRQLDAPRGGRGPAGRRQARALREAAGPLRRGRQGDGGRGRGGDHAGRRRLHLPAGARDQRDPGADPPGRDRRGASLQRPLLVRLRAEPGQPDQLALPRRPGQWCAGRHRQPHDRPRRVRLRPDHQRQRRGLPDLHHRASGPRRGHGRPRCGGGQRREGGGGQRGHRHLHGEVRQRRRRHVLDARGSRTACPTASASRSSRSGARRRTT